MDNRYTIRAARVDDLEHLPDIERAAAQLFVEAGWSTNTVDSLPVISVETHRAYLETGRLWVAADADDQPVGFAVASIIDGDAHLDEIDVHPDHGRRGLGRALIEQVCDWGRAQNLPAITLTTERDIPWNAPFYARLGFEIVPDDALTPALNALLQQEAAFGLQRETRVVMIRPFSD